MLQAGRAVPAQLPTPSNLGHTMQPCVAERRISTAMPLPNCSQQQDKAALASHTVGLDTVRFPAAVMVFALRCLCIASELEAEPDISKVMGRVQHTALTAPWQMGALCEAEAEAPVVDVAVEPAAVVAEAAVRAFAEVWGVTCFSRRPDGAAQGEQGRG